MKGDAARSQEAVKGDAARSQEAAEEECMIQDIESIHLITSIIRVRLTGESYALYYEDHTALCEKIPWIGSSSLSFGTSSD